ncbi:hypothetical protein COU54_05650 [Candidatus Pacearchaeota archaeon CG10_big_fil_rev_8_21_14_0_10_31_24]|nr:MAG: hypothetical protein COU54_05650 [Candidatus Pacearchaeota archaeon CG10_big_fil_rev_8_21_14_0_10_31_24]
MEEISKKFTSELNVNVLFEKLRNKVRVTLHHNLNDTFMDELLAAMKYVLSSNLATIKTTTASPDKILLFLNKKTFDYAYNFIMQQCSPSGNQNETFEETDRLMDKRMERQKMQQIIFPQNNSEETSAIPQELIPINTIDSNDNQPRPEELFDRIKKSRTNDHEARVTINPLHKPLGEMSAKPLIETTKQHVKNQPTDTRIETRKQQNDIYDDDLENYINSIKKVSSHPQLPIDITKIRKSFFYITIKNATTCYQLNFPYSKCILDSIRIESMNVLNVTEDIYITIKEIDNYQKGPASCFCNDNNNYRNVCGVYSFQQKCLLFKPHTIELLYNKEIAKNNPWMTFTLNFFNNNWKPLSIEDANMLFEVSYFQ